MKRLLEALESPEVPTSLRASLYCSSGIQLVHRDLSGVAQGYALALQGARLFNEAIGFGEQVDPHELVTCARVLDTLFLGRGSSDGNSEVVAVMEDITDHMRARDAHSEHLILALKAFASICHNSFAPARATEIEFEVSAINRALGRGVQ